MAQSRETSPCAEGPTLEVDENYDHDATTMRPRCDPNGTAVRVRKMVRLFPRATYPLRSTKFIPAAEPTEAWRVQVCILPRMKEAQKSDHADDKAILGSHAGRSASSIVVDYRAQSGADCMLVVSSSREIVW